jgi:hypothetical protein
LIEDVLKIRNFSVNIVNELSTGQRVSNPLSHPRMLQYFTLIARLTTNLLKKKPKKNEHLNDQYGFGDQSDSDSDEAQPIQRETNVSLQCIEMMNDNNGCILQACILAGPNDWSSEALEQISLICHNLLLSHKMAVHKYKYVFASY